MIASGPPDAGPQLADEPLVTGQPVLEQQEFQSKGRKGHIKRCA
jgi:hypothetical protein